MPGANEFRIADVATAAKVSLGTARRWAKEAGMGRLNEDGYRVLTETEYQILSRRQKMSSQTSGAKGGAVTRSRVGPDHYETIGQSGGETTMDRHGSEFFKALGKQGGDTTRERHGHVHYAKIGQRGGTTKRQVRRNSGY